MDEKTTNQNNQNGQNNSNNNQNKPTLSWTQPAQGGSQSGNTNKVNTPNMGNARNSAVATESTQSGFRTAAIVIGIFVVCVLAVWGMVSLRNKSDGAVSITGSSTDMIGDEATTTGTTETTTVTSPSNTTSTPSETINPNPPTPTTPPVVSASGSLPITVASPQAAGSEVAVSGVSVSSPTWFVVYENKNGAMGNALGAGLFLPGGVTSGTISLLRPTVAGQSYFVGESVDDGDKVFGLHVDPQTKDANGNVILATFQAN